MLLAYIKKYEYLYLARILTVKCRKDTWYLRGSTKRAVQSIVRSCVASVSSIILMSSRSRRVWAANFTEFCNYTFSSSSWKPTPFHLTRNCLNYADFTLQRPQVHAPAYIHTYVSLKPTFDSFLERLTTNWQSGRTSWKLVPTELTSLFRLPLDPASAFSPFLLPRYAL